MNGLRTEIWERKIDYEFTELYHNLAGRLFGVFESLVLLVVIIGILATGADRQYLTSLLGISSQGLAFLLWVAAVGTAFLAAVGLGRKTREHHGLAILAEIMETLHHRLLTRLDRGGDASEIENVVDNCTLLLKGYGTQHQSRILKYLALRALKAKYAGQEFR